MKEISNLFLPNNHHQTLSAQLSKMKGKICHKVASKDFYRDNSLKHSPTTVNKRWIAKINPTGQVLVFKSAPIDLAALLFMKTDSATLVE